MLSKIKYSPYYYLNSRQLNLSDFGLKINDKNPKEKIFSIAKNENMLLNFVELTYNMLNGFFQSIPVITAIIYTINHNYSPFWR